MSNRENSNTLSIYAMAFGNFSAGMSSLIVAGVLPEIAAGMAVSTGQVGQLITIYAIAYAISAPLIIAFTGQIERRVMLTVGLGLIVIGNGMAALAPTYGFLFMARIVTALGSASFIPLAAAVAIALSKPGEQGRASAIVFTGFTVATALGLPIGAYVGLNFGWRYSFGFIVALAIVGCYWVWQQLPHRVETPPVNLGSFGHVFRDGLLMIVLAVTILQFGGQMAVFTFISPWLQALTDLGAAGISTMLLLAGIGGIAGNYIAGLSTDRFGARATQLVLIIILAISMPMLFIMETSIIAGGLLIFVWGAVGQGFIAPQLVRVVGVNPALSSASLGLNASFINAGIALGSIVGSIYVDRVGIESITWLGAGVTILSLLVFSLSWAMENSRKTASA
ncbi:MAG: MFS transporter [Chloroflexota bacterium]